MQKIYGKDIYFRYVDVSDAEFIYQLRSNKELSQYIHAATGDVQGQASWIEKYKEREREGKEHYFIICLLTNEAVGVVRIYDIQKDSFSWGSWIIKKEAPMFVSIESVIVIYEYAFYHLGFKNCHFEAMKKNASVVRFHRGFGAKVINQNEDFYYYSISRLGYETSKKKYLKYYKPVVIREDTQ